MGRSADPSEKSLQILSAATRILSRHGYAGATVSRVVEEAQVARGLIHYYFNNKEDMLAKVLRANMKNSLELLAPLFKDCRSAEDLANKMIKQLKQMLKSNPDYFNLFIEGVAVSRHSEIVRNALDSLYNDFKTSLQKGLDNLIDNGTIRPAITGAGLAVVFTAMLDGMGVQFVSLKGASIGKQNWASLEQAILLLIQGRMDS